MTEPLPDAERRRGCEDHDPRHFVETVAAQPMQQRRQYAAIDELLGQAGHQCLESQSFRVGRAGLEQKAETSSPHSNLRPTASEESRSVAITSSENTRLATLPARFQ